MSSSSKFPQDAQEDLEIQEGPPSEAAILYLLQEATKLALPSSRERLELKAKRTENLTDQDSHAPVFHHSLQFTATSSEDREDDSNFGCEYTGSYKLFPTHKKSCPWDVMSLINLQCEKLLHPANEDVRGREFGPLSPQHMYCTEGNTEGSVGMVFHSTKQATLEDIFLKRKESIVGQPNTWNIHSQKENVTFSDDCDYQRVTLKDLRNECLAFLKTPVLQNPCDQNTAIPKMELSGAPLSNKEAEEICHLSLSDDTECLKNCSFTDGELYKEPVKGDAADILEAPSSSEEVGNLNMLACMIHQRSQKQEIDSEGSAFSTMGDPCVSVEQTLDCNSNLISTSEFQTSHKKRGEYQGESLPIPADDDAAGEELRTDTKWRGRTPRKQRHPMKSADLCDPDFQGVSFRMHTELSDSRDHCRLLITSKYSAEFWKNGRRSRGSRMRTLLSSLKASSSEEDSEPIDLSNESTHYDSRQEKRACLKLPQKANKRCASCGTRTTPLWRDAEDGTPLCNACGIRYKKYRVWCQQCRHIPKKEGNSSLLCSRCGDLLKRPSSRSRLERDTAAYPALQP